MRNQPNHGSNLRGARAIPRAPWAISRLQSERDRLLLIDKFVKRQAETKFESEDGFGNKNLPAYKHKREITDIVENYKAVILGGETGSGKSTQVPQFLHEAGYEKTFVLVPRRVIADGLHDRLVEEMAWKLGEEQASEAVGVLHGDRAETHENNSIVVMTPNTFLLMEKSLREDYGDKKIAIIADEIHEANLFTEIATGVAAQAVSQQETWRLIAMSATHNSTALMGSFSLINNGDVPSVNIEGRPFEMAVNERPDQSVSEVYIDVSEEHEKTMIFTSGKNEIKHIINQIIKLLEEQEKGSSSKVEFRILHGDLSRSERARIKEPVVDGKRLIIVSSPAGMSGITIPGVTCVISDGTINRPELDEDEVSGLQRGYLSYAEVIQQMGRAGRDVAGGVGYVAKPTSVYVDIAREQGKEIDDDMPYIPLVKRERFGPPEIYHSHLGRVALTVAALNRQFTAINMFLPHQIEESSILKSQEGLYRIGALRPQLEDDLFEITPIGIKMSKFAVRPELSRGLVEAVHNNRTQLQLARTALIVAAIEAGGLQDYNKDTAGDGWKKFLRDSTTDDMMAQYDILSALPFSHENDINEEFVKEHNLSYKHVERSLKVVRKIFKELGIYRHNIALSPPNSVEEGEIAADLTAGMIDSVYRKVGVRNKRQMYRNIHGVPGSTERYVSDRSVLTSSEHEYVTGIPRWFLRGHNKHDVIEMAMAVDPYVVAQYAKTNNILDRVIVGSKIVDGAVSEQYQVKFGSIAVGSPENGSFAMEIPVKSQEALVEHVLSNQGPAQLALRSVVAELERYTQRVPSTELAKRLKVDSGKFLTADKIEQEIRNAAKKTRIAFEVDRALSLFIYQANIGIGRYFTEKDRDELLTMSPDEIAISDTIYAALQYDSPERPYITMPQTEEGRTLIRKKSLRLPDGREVFVKRGRSDGAAEYISSRDV